MTAGTRRCAGFGLVIVAARLNPRPGSSTLSSPGRENAAVLDAADAMSSRAISIICAGMFMRSRPPFSIRPQVDAMLPAGGGLVNVIA